MNGKIDRIGFKDARLVVHAPDGTSLFTQRMTAADHRSAAEGLIDWLEVHAAFRGIRAVGHRVVHGMKHSEPQRVTRRLVAELRRLIPLDPNHLPGEIALIETLARRHPRLSQWACFDTSFHRTMPRVSRLLPLPRRYARKGIERYGFHGLSYAFLMEELGRLDSAAARRRVILAHLGNGASMAAVRDGKSIDTSMGFTSAAGLVMGTRSGDLDPGLNYYLTRTEGMTAREFHEMVTAKAGLLGVSGSGSDVRDLLRLERRDRRAADALGLFCHQAKKWLGAYAAVLGGLDTLVFAGGIGENSPQIRERICAGLGFLGIELHLSRNEDNAPVISRDSSKVRVRVIRTDEELMLARAVVRCLGREARA